MSKNKLYYTIGEVAKMLDTSSSAIRFWEKSFPSIAPKKKDGGIRKYTEKEIDKLKHIHYLVKEKKYTISGAQKVLTEKEKIILDEHTFSNQELKDLLIRTKTLLEKLVR